MDDYIRRRAAINAICQDWCGTSNADCKNPFDPATDDYYHCDGCDAVQLIKALPSAYVQPVVRCKECDYHQPPLAAVVNGKITEVTPMRCAVMFAYVKPDGWCYKFCKDGKRFFDEGEQNG